jgi:cytochrome b involved in lipid metabolism
LSGTFYFLLGCLIIYNNPFEGKDGTEEFDDAGHSKDAKELMKDYFIGELDLDETPDIPELEVYRKEQDMDFGSKLVAYAVQYWAVPVAAVGISAVVAILYARRK